jgi:hypothetical protein
VTARIIHSRIALSGNIAGLFVTALEDSIQIFELWTIRQALLLLILLRKRYDVSAWTQASDGKV